MPLMMDDEMDIDDLFGDGNALSLPQTRPPPKELFQRVDELRESGCCQGISWSKWGSIASISSSGFGVDFRNLRCSPKDGTWDLAGPTSLPQIAPNVNGGPLKHVCWSPNGCDLAVIDAVGRLSILTIAVSLNRPNISRTGQFDTLDDIHTVVGAQWLNLMPARQQATFIYRRATTTDEGWRYDVSQGVSYGPCYPHYGKAAFLCITTNGLLRLLYPHDNKWMESTLEIESVVSSDELITHASICAEQNDKLLVAFATTTKQLRVVRVTLEWTNAQNPKQQINPGQTHCLPTMTAKHIAVTNWMDVGNAQDSFHIQPSMVSLSGIHILPCAPDGPSEQGDLPVVLTFRHQLPSATTHFNQETHTIIDRWEIKENPQAVHSAFEQISSRRNSTASTLGNAMTLKKIDGLTIGKVLLTVDSVALDRTLVLAYSDGSVEYRNRWTLAELYTEGSIDQFSHMSQTGFTIDDDEPCLQVAISPTSCSAIKLGTNGKTRWKALKYQLGEITSEIDTAQYSAIVAGLSMTLTTAIMSSTNSDDLLAIGKHNIMTPNFLFEWLTETCRILKFSLDFSEESHHDNLVRNPSTQLCLSIQNSYGFNGNMKAKDFSAKIAWIGLQTRNCVVLLTMATSMKVPVDASQVKKISGLEDAEAVRLLTGSIKWCLDLMSYIIDSLLHPTPKTLFKSISNIDDNSASLESITKTLIENNNIGLHLLLCSATRGFLTAICRRLTHLDYTARKAMADAAAQSSQPSQPADHISNSLRNSYTAVATLTSAAPVQFRYFEKFLTNVSAAVKDSYSAAGLSSTPAPGQAPNMTNAGSEKRNKIEQTMLFGGPIAEELRGATEQVFRVLLPQLRSVIDPSKLFFHDFSILSMEVPSPPTSNGSKTAASQNDSFLRTPLGRYPHGGADDTKGNTAQNVPSAAAASGSKDKKYRRCARCAAVMEDMNSRRAAVNFLIMQQRRCFCGGYWVLLSAKEVGL